jgi:MFS family permease
MNAWRALRDLPRPLWVLCFATLVNRMGTMVVPFLALYLVGELGYSPEAAGGVLALYGVTAFVAGPLSGRLADRIGPLRIMKVALLLTGVLQLLFPWGSHPAAILGMTVALAGAAESYRPAAMTVVADLAPPEQRRQAYAALRLAINLGMSVGPALGGFLATVSFRAIFLVDGVTTLLCLAVLVAARVKVPPRAAPEAQAPAASLWSGLEDVRLRGFLLGVFAISVVSFQGESTMPLFLVRDLALSPSTYGLAFTVNTALIVALEIPLTAALATWDVRRTLAVGAFLYAAGFGALALVTGTGGVMATVVVWTFGEMLFSPSASAYIAEMAPPARRGAYMGLFAATFSLAFVAAPLVGMWSLERLGPHRHWLAMFALGTVATALVARGVPARRALVRG